MIHYYHKSHLDFKQTLKSAGILWPHIASEWTAQELVIDWMKNRETVHQHNQIQGN